MAHPYEDILDIPYPFPGHRAALTKKQRAAQFSPFAALRGFSAVIAEINRQTTPRRELAEEEKLELGRRLMLLHRLLPQKPEITVTFFRPDPHKEGGEYITLTGQVRTISQREQYLRLEEGDPIPFRELWTLESPDLEEALWNTP